MLLSQHLTLKTKARCPVELRTAGLKIEIRVASDSGADSFRPVCAGRIRARGARQIPAFEGLRGFARLRAKVVS